MEEQRKAYDAERVDNGDDCRSCGREMQGKGLGVKRCCGCCGGTCESCASAEKRECCECTRAFTVTDSEKAFCRARQISTPRRCKPCRDRRREEKLREGRG